MTEIVLFHSALGLRPGVTAAADRLRAAGQTVHTPDYYDGEVFDDLGGFDLQFPVNYNDADLCLRLAQPGRKNYLAPRARLYHLEGQSRSAALRELAEPYNRWLFARRWSSRKESP